MSRVRPFDPADIPEIAALTWRFLYAQPGAPPPSLERYLRELFFVGPLADPQLPSLVYVDPRGEPVGFLGVVRRRMMSAFGCLKIALGSNFIVHPKCRSSQASLQLARSFFAEGQDLSVSDTANEASRAIWHGFGGVSLPRSDRRWSRPLRPINYALSAISRFRGALATVMSSASKPLCQLADVMRMNLCATNDVPGKSVPLDVSTLLTSLAQSWNGHAVHPVYDKDSLQWLLTLMRESEARGQLRMMAVQDDAGLPVGCYVYYAKPGAIGEVVYVGGKEPFLDRVLDHLFYDAAALGVIALHGTLDATIAPRLAKRLCFFFNGHDPLLVHSRRPELMRVIQTNGIPWTRLDGEWCLKFGFDSADCSLGGSQSPLRSSPSLG